MLSFRDLGVRLFLPAMLVALSTTTVAPPLGAPRSPPSKAVVDHWPPYDDDLYGPHFITANPSSDTWYEDVFSTKLMPGAKYFLKVNNPAPGASGAIGNFSVKLNGVYVADPGMMGGQSELVKEVPLQAFNRIEVWTAPGSGQLRVIIRMEPMTHIAPAYAERVQPAPGQADVTKSWQVTVPADAGGNRILVIDNGDYDRSGRIGAQEWGEIKINGVHAATFDTLHLEQSKLVVPVNLPNGTSTIQAILNQVVPGAHVHVRLMYADTAKPKLTVSAPANGAVVSSPSVTVSGTYNDPMWGSVNVGNTQSYQSVWLEHLAGVQSWSVSHPLNVGLNTVKIWARDGAGNTSDTVTRVVTRQTGSGSPLTVAVQGRNPGVTIDRGECLTIAAGDDAAYECGDLRLVHPLPAIRTMNRLRAPTLIFNSGHADGGSLIAADVSVAAGHTPTSLEATVIIDGKPPVTRSIPWNSQFSDGQPRRIVVRLDASNLGLTTGMYPYRLEVKSVGAPDTPPVASDTGTIVIVDRSSSPFGAGWWLVGLEQLVNVSLPTADKKLWIGGDGSTRLYVRQGTSNTWLATPTLDRPDSLQRFVTFNPDGTPAAFIFLRKLPQGGFVEFGDAGRHVATVNRLGHRTTFVYDGALLKEIKPATPAGSTANVSYVFNYTNDAFGQPYLSSVATPARPSAPRSTVLTPRSSSRSVEQITDADGRVVRFSYDAQGRIDGRQNRRTDWTFYKYDEANLLKQVVVDLRRTATQATISTRDSIIVTNMCAAEGVSLTSCSEERMTALEPRPLGKVYTWADGARWGQQDTTIFYLNRFGGPDTIVNALGHKTRLERSDVQRFPILVTALVQPNGFRSEMTYTERGLPDVVTAKNPLGNTPAQDAITRYSWHAKWNSVTKVERPGTETVEFDYDTITGNRLWEQRGPSDTRRVHFTYYDGTGLLATVTAPSPSAAPAKPDSIVYDTQLGNVAHTRTARGFLELFIRDFLGRDSLVFSPPSDTVITMSNADSVVVYDAGMRQSYEYDLWDRVRQSRTEGRGASPATLFVLNEYDEEGNLTRVDRLPSPDPAFIVAVVNRYGYDAAGRKVAEVAPDGLNDSTFYDPAGNVDSVRTRRGHVVRMTYDLIGRLQTRILPAVSYDPFTDGVARPLYDYLGPYPRLPNAEAGRYTIPAETHQFAYDALGNITRADNPDALVRRTYYPSGWLETETQKVQTLARNDTTKHVYAIRYERDLNGRVKTLTVPSQLAVGTTGVVRYEYSADEGGALERVWDLQGNAIRYAYARRGEVNAVEYSGQVTQRIHYDADGNPIRDSLLNVGGVSGARPRSLVMRASRVSYDARAKLLLVGDSTGHLDTLRAEYTGIGHLRTSTFTEYGQPVDDGAVSRYFSRETITHDPLGNIVSRTSESEQRTPPTGPLRRSYRRATSSIQYQQFTGRLIGENLNSAQGAPKQIRYDDAGNAVFSMLEPSSNGGPAEDRASFYGADNKLRAQDFRLLDNGFADATSKRAVFEEYRYDALGRRVWVRAQRVCEAYENQYERLECGLSLVRRTVWDGEQELAEIQMPGGEDESGQPDPLLENDTAPAILPRADGDPNPYFGHVVYTHGLGIDQPLAVTRFNYVDWVFNANPAQATVRPPATFRPFWNIRGEAEQATFASGDTTSCARERAGVQVCLPLGWLAYDRDRYTPPSWSGTIVEDKRDKAETHYRRNRYYDPRTGRFTQEDPIGLAGGMNLYGFAEGDPVNSSDAFGLCAPWCIGAVGGAIIGAAAGAGGRALFNYLNDRPIREGVGTAALYGAGGGAVAGATFGVVAPGLVTSLTMRTMAAVGLAPAGPIAAAAGKKIPFEGFQQWGRSAVRWGQEAAGAVERTSNITTWEALRLNPEKVRMARDFYQRAVDAGEGGLAAPQRVQLMNRILELQRGAR